MKTKFIAGLLAAAAMASCTAKTETVADADGQPESVALKGEWNIENVVLNDSVSVRPSEVDSLARQYIVFDDSCYYIKTNCNSISGSYALAGDSIVLSPGAMTMMACENMETEDLLSRVLPAIVVVAVENDSTVRLNSADASEYIELRKSTEAE